MFPAFMPATLDTSMLGEPVEVGQIGKEIKKLWEASGGAKTRASLINFAVYCEGAARAAANTEWINEFTRNHACRALLIIAEPQAAESKVSAWVNAHCHLGRAGAKQVCCEQVSFLLEGKACHFIPNIVFANLDSDLPLHFWWQGEFHDPIDEQLWAWVDRLIYDSQAWRDPRQQFALLEASIAAAQSRLTLCDLNWARSLRLRQAVAQMFDHPENAPLLPNVQRVEIAHAPEYGSTALLLVGWFVAQLRLTLQRQDAGGFVFTTAEGHEVRFDLREEAGRSISRCDICSGDAGVKVVRDAEGDFFDVEVRLADGRIYRHLMPAGSNRTLNLLTDEIGLGSRHRVYLKALAATRELL
jgi:glucose-6-phosphate dehydrogenase assembly protein OpcA